jgi:hypothetical protein
MKVPLFYFYVVHPIVHLYMNTKISQAQLIYFKLFKKFSKVLLPFMYDVDPSLHVLVAQTAFKDRVRAFR